MIQSSFRIGLAILCLGCCGIPAIGQPPGATEPTEGLRDITPQIYALQHLKIVISPERQIESGTILIRDGQIVAVGEQVEIPAGAQRLDRSGHTAYAGFIDAYSEIEVADPSRDSGAPHWNGNIMPQRRASQQAASSAFEGAKLRSQGITIRVLVPEGGIVRGTSCTVLCRDGDSGQVLIGETDWQHLALTVPRRRGGGRDSYPNSPMGAMALLRQSLLDANWYTQAWAAYRGNPSLPRPKTDVALETLAAAIHNCQFVIDAPNERMALRAEGIAQEFGLKIVLRGSGSEYRQLDDIVATQRPLLIPVDFPDAPKITAASDAREVSLAQLLDWELAPSNPARLAEQGVEFCLTTDGLSDPGKFLQQVRTAVEAGLQPAHALAAITTTPAKLLGLEDMAGTIQPGRLANLVITDGELFDAKTKTMETWVAGERYEVTTPENKQLDPLVGDWLLTADLVTVDQPESLSLQLSRKGKSLVGKLSLTSSADANAEEEGKDEEGEDEDESKKAAANVELKNLVVERDRLIAAVDLGELHADYPSGISWLNFIISTADEAVEVVDATLRLPSGEMIAVNIAAATNENDADEDDADEDDADEDDAEEDDAEEDEAEEDDAEEDDAEEDDAEEDDAEEDDADEDDSSAVKSEAVEVIYPLGAYGLAAAPESPEVVMFRGATVWTCGDAGIIEGGDVLVRDGKIVAVGTDLEVPEGCTVVDVTGKHLTPGLIDCHSHMATDGGVNESGQAITAEVRVGDFINNTDISIYRQLAGGLTTSNILHGSANPIGGQNQVIKLRWGATMDAMKFSDAPFGIKFALGENVKRSAGRYPDTRMGVEQIIRDQLLAAAEYAEAHRRYASGDRSTLPPRVDLQSAALAEILAGERWIHCHSYRQDEILALLDVLDELGITIGSLQHILEGYKVADRMAEHGAMASSFSDWWAYKFEVYDAIPYNGAIMHDAGIVVSFNSDDAELARHLNTEAAKAVKYGGVSPEEALKFVTLNPAKQLRIDDRVGSLEVGKDADLAVWSRQPLSTMTRCEQTWIDGVQYFSLERDAELRARDAELHARLVQKALGADGKPSGARRERIAEADRWHQHDIFCLHHDHGHDHAESEHHEEGEALSNERTLNFSNEVRQ